MCHVSQHSCACTEITNARTKVVHRRVILCAPDTDCPVSIERTADPSTLPKRIVVACADFHIGPQPVFPYRCAFDRPGVEMEAEIGVSSPTRYDHDNQVLEFLDQDCVTSFEHLAKTDLSGSTEFIESSFSSGDILVHDEYVDFCYRTGYVFIEARDGTYTRTLDGTRRGREEGHDPTPDDQNPYMRHNPVVDMRVMYDSDGGVGQESEDEREVTAVDRIVVNGDEGKR